MGCSPRHDTWSRLATLGRFFRVVTRALPLRAGGPARQSLLTKESYDSPFPCRSQLPRDLYGPTGNGNGRVEVFERRRIGQGSADPFRTARGRLRGDGYLDYPACWGCFVGHRAHMRTSDRACPILPQVGLCTCSLVHACTPARSSLKKSGVSLTFEPSPRM